MFDCHVHAGPDVLPRIGDDAEIGAAYANAGYDGFVLKAHYESTVGRAHAVAAATGLEVYGGIALNQHTGGVNASAVAATLSSGGRIVWMPTADSHTQQEAGLPRLCDGEPRLGRHFYAIPPVDYSRETETREVLSLIADHDAVLATGHVSDTECQWLLEQSGHYGIGRLLFTHPSYTVPNLSLAAIEECAASGAYIEITCYQLLHQPDCSAEFLAQVAKAAGKQLVLSSDAGQPTSPTPPEALQFLVDTLAAQGLDREWLIAAAGEVPRALLAR